MDWREDKTMRIWIGEEQEGMFKGIPTLFVETTHLWNDKQELVFKSLEKHNIKRVYLGAGRTDCIFIENCSKFVARCYGLGIEIIQEMSITNAFLLYPEVAEEAEVILTIRQKNIPYIKNPTFKIDDYVDAIVFQNIGMTSIRNLHDVNDNIYADDIIIFSSEK